MKRKYVLIFIFNVLLFIVLGCTAQKKDLHNEFKLDIGKINKNDTVYYSQIFENFKVIVLETNNNSVIGSVSSVRFCNDHIIVLDNNTSNSVFVFDINGKFIRKIGSIGKGPGEFITPYAISTDESKNEIAIYDAILNRIQLYSLSGTFIKSIQLDQTFGCKSIEIYDEKIFVANHLDGASKYFLYAIDYNGKVVHEWLPNKSKLQAINSWAPYNVFFRTPYGLRYRAWFLDEVYTVNKNTLKPILTIETEQQLTIEELGKKFKKEAHNNELSFVKPYMIKSYAEMNKLSIVECYINDNRDNYVLFYDHENNIAKCVKEWNFIDDISNLRYKESGWIYTSYNDYLVTIIHSFTLEHLIEEVVSERFKYSNNELENLTIHSNPVILMYKCKEKPVL
jgi:hypothetical protein